MNCNLRHSSMFLVITAAIAQKRYGQEAARVELNLGAEAFRQSKYEKAIARFEKVVSSEPENQTGHLYLATACQGLYIPGGPTRQRIFALLKRRSFTTAL
jgi:Tfp pilus assembly protein PilF